MTNQEAPVTLGGHGSLFDREDVGDPGHPACSLLEAIIVSFRATCSSAMLFLVLAPLPALGIGGEDCASAAVIATLPFTDSGDTCSALDDYNESCPFTPTGGRDVVYRYTPNTDVTVSIDLCSSDFDTKVYLYTGSCPTVSNSDMQVACNDDACGENGWRSRLVAINLVAGVDYFIVIDGYGASDCGSYDLTIIETPLIPSDRCEIAETISIPWSGTVSTTQAFDDYNESCPFPVTGGPDVVRRFVAGETGEMSIDLCESNFDTKVYVYEGTCPPAGTQTGSAGSGTAIGCNDDACGVNGFRSRMSFLVTEGVEYFVVFDGYGSSDFGDVSVTITPVLPPGPGETCELAIPIPALPYLANGTTEGASRFEHECQFVFGGAPENFYRYTPTQDTWIEIDSCGSEFDTEITVIGGPCPITIEPTDASVLACNDDGCGLDATRARIAAVFVAAGETVTIVIDGHGSGDSGEYSLLVRETCAPDYPSQLSSLIDVGTRPIGLALHEDTGRLFVTNFGDGTLSVIDTATDTVEATTPPLGAGAYRLGFTPDGTRLYSVHYAANQIVCIDPVTLDLIDSFPALGLTPLGLTVTPDGSTLFVATAGDGRVTKWSIPGHQVLGEVGGLGAPREMIASPEGDFVYVTDPGGPRVWEIAVDTLVATPIAVDEFPQALALTENGQHLLVGNFGFDRSLDHASVVDRSSRQVVARLRIGTGPEEMVLVTNTPYLAVTNWGFSHHPNLDASELGSALGNVAIVRLPDFSLVGDPIDPPMIDAIEMIIPVEGDYTFGIAVSPDGDKIYATNSGYPGPAIANTVSVVKFPAGMVSGRFVRGDPNADGLIDIADPVALLGFLFGGGDLDCASSGDVNDDELLDVADPIALLGALFSGAPAPPAPSSCAADPTAGGLCCLVGCAP